MSRLVGTGRNHESTQAYTIDLGNVGASSTLPVAGNIRATLTANTAFTLNADGSASPVTLVLAQDADGGWVPTLNGVSLADYVNPIPYSTSVVICRNNGGNWYIEGQGSVHDCPVFLDFKNQNYYIDGVKRAPAAAMVVTRTTLGAYVDSTGLAKTYGNGLIRTGDLGLLVESTRTNVVLYNRDLTNAAWTKTNVTAAKTQTGIDGVANSASSITATAGNGTCLQAIVLASSARFQTAYVKRITGTGTVEMTMDNGTTWTAITVTSSWARVSIATQTLANPTVGFRLATSGDAIAVDYVQNENGTYATSPIATTSAATARNQDAITLIDFDQIPLSAATVVAIGTTYAPTSETNVLFSLDDGTSNERIHLRHTSTTCGMIVVDGGTTQASITVAATKGTRQVMVGTYTANGFTFSANGTSGTSDTSGTLPTPTTARIGFGFGSSYWVGYIEKIIIFNRILTAAERAEMGAL